MILLTTRSARVPIRTVYVTMNDINGVQRLFPTLQYVDAVVAMTEGLRHVGDDNFEATIQSANGDRFSGRFYVTDRSDTDARVVSSGPLEEIRE